jgi:chromate transport protein ChrA
VNHQTKRIFLQTLKNLTKLFAFVSACFAYMIGCLWLSMEFSGDVYFGMAAFFIPMIIASVWDMSRSQVESQIYDEERTINALKREY